jgi:uncharacterized protein
MFKLQLFTMNAMATFLEAAPFLLFGALLSALFESYVSQEKINSWIPKKRRFGLLLGVAMGMIFPTCECGIVPIIKRMIEKKVPSYIAITYMLAAPVINPIVLFSTYIAFRGNIYLVLTRVAIISLVAIIIGSYFALHKGLQLIKDNPITCSCGHDHGQEHHHEIISKSFKEKLSDILKHTAQEFLEMGKYLIIGCFAASFFKTFFPREILTFFQSNMLLSVVFMMSLAVLLSVCAAADSFIATSFSRMPLMAQMSFVTLGPMFDLKLLAMYLGAFNKKVVWKLIIAIVALNFIITYTLGAFLWK